MFLCIFPHISSVQFSRWVMSDSFVTSWTAACLTSLSITNSLELAPIHVLPVSDAIQPSHPLSSPSPAFNLSRPQGLFHWVSASHLVAKILEFQLQHSVLPMNIQDWFPLGLTGFIFYLSKWLSRVFSNTTVQKHQCFGAQLSLWSNSHIHIWLQNHSFDGPLLAK